MNTNNWIIPEKPTPLKLNEVHVWSAKLSCSQMQRERFYQTLSTDEKERSARFHFDKDRFDYIVGRGILRQLIGTYKKIDPSKIVFDYGKHGKPRITDALQTSGGQLEFNVSHSHGMALFAFAIDRELGVDIEQIRPLSDGHSIAERFFSKSEYEKFASVPPSLQSQAFFNCWTRKEAFIKAIGDGLTYPLDGFAVTLTPGVPAKLLHINENVSEAAKWDLRSLEPKEKYVGAIIAQGDQWQLTQLRWFDELFAV